MQKSLFSKYFSASASLILVSIGIFGISLLIFASRFFQVDSYKNLESCVDKAVGFVNVDGSGIMNHDSAQEFFEMLRDAHDDAVIFMVTPGGRTMLCSESTQECQHRTFTVSEHILSMIRDEHTYREQGKLDGIYEEHYYTVGKPVYTKEGHIAGFIFASSNATGPLQDFLLAVLKMFLISAVVVLVLVCVIIYFVTYQMVQPLKEMSEAAIKFGNGDFTTRITVHAYDEMGQLAMALNNMAESLSSLETMRRSFVSNVSHELKTPMTTIGGFIDGILDGTIPQNQQKRYLRIVSEEIKRLSTIVRSMLDLARIEAGEMELNTKRFEVVDTIIQTLFSLEQQIDDKKLEIRGLDHDKVYVEADENLVHQVVYNLTENAIKFADEGGYIEFTFMREGNRILIGVKNSGEGLSKEEIPHVFDRFYKTDKSRGQDKSGVGLGLYIVRSIVTLHGGDVIVRSVKGEYCEFLFSLPISKQKTVLKLKKN